MLGSNNGRQRLVEEWSDDDSTFVTNHSNNNIETQQHQQQQENNNQWCRKCTTEGKMSGAGERLWSKSGLCDTDGCPGYKGHHPASRPQGKDSMFTSVTD